MTKTQNYTAANVVFWQKRGERSDRRGHEVTLLSEHPRYVAYIHVQEMKRLTALVGTTRPRLLDVGCGAGRLALELAPRCREVFGIDIAESLLERARDSAREKGIANATFNQRSLDAPFGLGTFDVVLVSGVLNCLDDGDAEAALLYCVESLAPGGTLYMRNSCAVRERINRPGTDEVPPNIHRSADEYIAMVRATPSLALREEGYLFPPVCAPNMAYYHAIPKSLRNTEPVRAALDAWFRLEERTAEVRLRWLAPAYRAVLVALHKRTFFHVIEATRTT